VLFLDPFNIHTHISEEKINTYGNATSFCPSLLNVTLYPEIWRISLVYCNYRAILSLKAPNKFGKSIPEFGKTHSSVLGCERRPVSASIMSRSCFALFIHFHFSFSSHYLNNIIFIDNSLGTLATESPYINSTQRNIYFQLLPPNLTLKNFTFFSQNMYIYFMALRINP
jgi:hypothetical protein